SKARNAITRVFSPAQEGQNIFDVCRFKKFEPAKLHKRNIATDELDLHLRAVLRRTEKHSLRPKTYACFAICCNLGSTISSLIGPVAHTHELWQLGRG